MTNSHEWKYITYSDFIQDVELFSRYWRDVLHQAEVYPGSVVTFCLPGYAYIDILHIYGVMRAGYIPQPLTIVPTATFIISLLLGSCSKAIIYAPSFEAKASELSARLNIPNYPALLSIPDRSQVAGNPLPDLPTHVRADDTAIYFHTSGSTSGMPKIIPGNQLWMHGMVKRAVNMSDTSGDTFSSNKVYSWMGSVCHIAQFFGTIRVIAGGHSLVQPLNVSNDPFDLIESIPETGITQITLFPVSLSRILRRARAEERIRNLLKQIDAVSYSGGDIPPEDEQWARTNGINIVNVYASTECGGPMMISEGTRFSSHNGLRPLQGVQCRFDPISSESSEGSLDDGVRELVILSQSLGCPHPSLCDPSGLFHTGDLFREIQPGCYLTCGRDDDWIKMENAARCDTRTIEDEVRRSCKDLVSDCVVVGKHRPKPALFVEALHTTTAIGSQESQLRNMIFERIADLQKDRYETERISGPEMIVLIPLGSLPRTESKGNIRRALVEEKYQTVLEQLYNRSK
ncbi:acetyl-CoA synthetase-like protein [Dendrothele bispora CBS 962.96]|uniref:Acetyl-CoA synthetase-like protein n=1 Tax=Dendrothele bispora (strain CBS 962.96) TaxID=1314807 RepID=A0A4S8LUT8_DENBC|nr:acetyl-CoA synthetase-like protein [Dendrothele bispora CBS 962.96]